MKTLFDYCRENIDVLKTYIQPSFEWKSRFILDQLCENDEFRNVMHLIPDLIDRGQIIRSIKNRKYYQAFVEIMLWGQVGARPGSNKSKTTEIAKVIFSYSSEKIKHIFETVLRGDIEMIKQLFSSLEKSGEYKIPEVDVSYFTKLLSFASFATTREDINLLIYDKWTKLIHIHLLFDFGKNNDVKSLYSFSQLKNLYSKTNDEKNPTTKLILPIGGTSLHAYINYCEQMSELTKLINSNTNSIIKPFDLEGFLFGRALRGKSKKVFGNPRYWVQQNFASQYLPYCSSL
jgi:hypothetical protein